MKLDIKILTSVRIAGVGTLLAMLTVNSCVSVSASISQKYFKNQSLISNIEFQRLLAQNTEIVETPFGCVSLTGTIDDSDTLSSSDNNGDPEGVPGGMRYEAYRYQVPPGSLLAFEVSSQDFQPVIALRITGRYIEDLSLQQNQGTLSVVSPSVLQVVRATDSSRILKIGAIIPRSQYAEMPLPGGGRESAEYELIIGSSGSGDYSVRGGVVGLESPPQPSEQYVIGLDNNQTSTALEMICQNGQ